MLVSVSATTSGFAAQSQNHMSGLITSVLSKFYARSAAILVNLPYFMQRSSLPMIILSSEAPFS